MFVGVFDGRDLIGTDGLSVGSKRAIIDAVEEAGVLSRRAPGNHKSAAAVDADAGLSLVICRNRIDDKRVRIIGQQRKPCRYGGCHGPDALNSRRVGVAVGIVHVDRPHVVRVSDIRLRLKPASMDIIGSVGVFAFPSNHEIAVAIHCHCGIFLVVKVETVGVTVVNLCGIDPEHFGRLLDGCYRADRTAGNHRPRAP